MEAMDLRILFSLLILPQLALAQADVTADSTHSFWNWTFENDSVVQSSQGVQEYAKGRLVRETICGTDDRGKPDTLYVTHAYDALGRRLHSSEYHSYFSDCVRFEKFVPDSLALPMLYGFDDYPEGYHYSTPCWVVFRAEVKWAGDLAVRTAQWHDGSSVDSVRFDALERPLHIVRYADQTKTYEEHCSYASGPGDSLMVQREIWDNGRSMDWLRKYRVMKGDTIVVFDAIREKSSDNVLREAFWIYNDQSQQVAFLSQVNGKEETKVLIAYDDNGMVKEHQRFYQGQSTDEIMRWNWTKTSSGYEIFYQQGEEVSYTKSTEVLCGEVRCKWIYASLKPWTAGESLEGKLDQLQLTSYTEYDQQNRILFQQNYQNKGRLTYQARHAYGR